jgi:galactokinase
MASEQRRQIIEQEFIKNFGYSPTLWAQAPGRVDLMGSHTDYNLGYVLTQAIDRNVWIAARPRYDGVVRVCSLNLEGCGEFDLADIHYSHELPWTNYIAGVGAILKEEGYALQGFNGLLHSTIPIGSGLSSSAAVEVATGVLFDALGNLNIDPVRMAMMCQRAENEFVGMRCGILDQYSSIMGKAGRVLLLDCRDITSESIPIAPGLQVMICDTRSHRELTGSEYPERRAQCEEGARVLSRFYPQIESLRDATLEQLQAHKADLDPVVYKRCQFIIEENQRVLDLATALAKGDHDQAGRLEVESFEGARDLYEIVSGEMQAMFDAIMSAPGAFGARGAGAGFGGCLVAFVRSDLIHPFAQHVAEQYAASTSIVPEIYPVQAAEGTGVLTFE